MNSNYQFTVKPWSIYRLNSNNLSWEWLSRHRKYSHAEGIAKSLQSLTGVRHQVVWNVPKKEVKKPETEQVPVPVK